jgi:hypothetical protein
VADAGVVDVSAQAWVRALRTDFRAEAPSFEAQLAIDPLGLPTRRLVSSGVEFRAEGGDDRVSVRLPARANGPWVISAAGISLQARILGATDATATPADGVLVYRGALGDGTLVHVPSDAGTEEFLHLPARPTEPVLRYEIVLDRAAGLRETDGVLEVLDADGIPRLRTSAPWVLDARGRRVRGTLTVEGCAVDRSGALPWGRPVVPIGSDRCVVRTTWPDGDLVYPVLVDPAWTATTRLVQQRHRHAAAPMDNAAGCTAGCVLVSGGLFGTTVLASAEVFNAASGTWAAIASLAQGRYDHASAPTGRVGRVLVAGGAIDTNAQPTATDTAAVYDPATAVWRSSGALRGGARYGSAVAWLPGDLAGEDYVVVISGGRQTDGAPNDNVDWRDPKQLVINDGYVFSTPFKLTLARAYHAMVGERRSLGRNLRFVVAGGEVAPAAGSVTASLELAEINFTSTTTVTPFSTRAAVLANARSRVGAAVVGGSFYVAGGVRPLSIGGFTDIDRFDLATITRDATWTGVLSSGRSLFRKGATAADGALFVGSHGSASQAFDRITSVVSSGTLSVSRGEHTVTALPDGRVLIAGGYIGQNASQGYATREELYTALANGTACTSAAECRTGFCSDGVCCDTACTGVCGACNLPGKAGQCSPVAGAPAPGHGACPGSPPCGSTCDGTTVASCTFAGTSTACGTATCNVANEFQPRGSCNGSGSCILPPKQGCGVYACRAASGCAASCSGNADCATGYACRGGTCQTTGGLGTVCEAGSQCASGFCVDGEAGNKVCCAVANCESGFFCAGTAAGDQRGRCLARNGSKCTAGTECASGICTDGVCCESPCDGQCEACDSVPGKCVAITGAPRASRPACADGGGDVCAALSCNGTDRIKCVGFKNGPETTCRPASCTGDRLERASTCDGSGNCVPKPAESCGAYRCGEASCRTDCETNDHCASGYVCAASRRCEPIKSTCSDDKAFSIPADGTPQKACAPFRCNPSTGDCFTRCVASDECAVDHSCDVGRCVAPAPQDEGGCAVSTPGHARSFGALLGLLLVAGAVRRRRS